MFCGPDVSGKLYTKIGSASPIVFRAHVFKPDRGWKSRTEYSLAELVIV